MSLVPMVMQLSAKKVTIDTVQEQYITALVLNDPASSILQPQIQISGKLLNCGVDFRMMIRS